MALAVSFSAAALLGADWVGGGGAGWAAGPGCDAQALISAAPMPTESARKTFLKAISNYLFNERA
jgi:hypothetical protein